MSRRAWLVAFAVLLLALLGGISAALGYARHALAPRAEEAPEVLFTVSRGDSLGQVARELEAFGLVRDARVLTWWARSEGLAGSLRTGEYRLSASLPAPEILQRIVRGEVATWKVVVPEGFTAVQIAERLEEAGLADAAAFRAAAFDPASVAALGVEGESLEGYLFPNTYHLPRGLSPLEVARAFVDQFLAVWREIEPLAGEQKLSMREVVTLASIVEKETGVAEERPLIAAVFRNRMERGMRLETDPTVIYGIEDFDGNLRREDLENRENPYNTYLIPALPPGPIASPGARALRAVVEPADSDYIFFVSKNDGTHVFSRTYAEHEVAVNRYQRRRSR